MDKTANRSHTIQWKAILLLAVIALLAYPFAAVQASGTAQGAGPAAFLWKTQRVDTPQLFHQMSDRSLRYDSDNRPHFAYGGDHLYYTRMDSNGNLIQTLVDGSFGVGLYASLALDDNNRAHIAYYDVINRSLNMRLHGSSWPIQTVDSPSLNLTAQTAGDLEEFSVADGQPLVESLGEIELERAWEAPTLSFIPEFTMAAEAALTASSGGVGLYASIDVDDNDRPHISYYDEINGDLKYS